MTEYLLERNFLVFGDGPYHKAMPREMVEILQNRFTLTALHLRGRADRIAIHRFLPIEFEWEAKTHSNPRYSDITIEALPLAHHIHKAALGVRCLYVHRNPFTETDCGFWVNDLPSVAKLFIQARWTGAIRKSFLDILPRYFPGAKLVQPTTVMGGSNDPFVIISSEVADRLIDWQECIDGLLSNGSKEPML